MTQKELLYLEDAIGHETALIKICNSIIEQLEDEELKNFMEDEVEIHKTTKDRLLNIMEECIDEWSIFNE